jgi:hypothetical protein
VWPDCWPSGGSHPERPEPPNPNESSTGIGEFGVPSDRDLRTSGLRSTLSACCCPHKLSGRHASDTHSHRQSSALGKGGYPRFSLNGFNQTRRWIHSAFITRLQAYSASRRLVRSIARVTLSDDAICPPPRQTGPDFL